MWGEGEWMSVYSIDFDSTCPPSLSLSLPPLQIARWSILEQDFSIAGGELSKLIITNNLCDNIK